MVLSALEMAKIPQRKDGNGSVSCSTVRQGELVLSVALAFTWGRSPPQGSSRGALCQGALSLVAGVVAGYGLVPRREPA